MIKSYLKPLTVLLAVAGFSMNASAQAPTCDNIVWNDVALEQLPTAPEHCLEVVNRDGGWYAKMHARIMRQNSSNTIVSFKNPDGNWSGAERTHPVGFTVTTVEGNRIRIKDVMVGQEVNVYALGDTYFSLPEPPAAAEPMEAEPMAEPEPEPEPAPVMLPKTAGNANWLAVIGTLLVLLSSVLYLRRNA